jgi:hypothetical protein
MDYSGMKIKTAIDLQTSLSEVGATAGVVASANPLFLLKDITKDSSGTFTLTFNNSVSAIAESYLSGASGEDTSLSINSLVMKVSFDAQGRIAVMDISMNLNMAMSTQGISYSVGIVSNQKYTVTGWDGNVSIQFPDFSGYTEYDYGDLIG